MLNIRAAIDADADITRNTTTTTSATTSATTSTSTSTSTSASTSTTTTTYLPQHASRAQQLTRAARLTEARLQYRWAYGVVGDAAVLEDLPPEEHPSRRWLVQMRRIEQSVRRNTDAVALRRKERDEPPQLFDDNDGDGEKGEDEVKGDLKGDAFQKFKDQFATIELSIIAHDNQFLRDDMFAWYRVAGPNPMQIKAVSQKDLQAHFPDLDTSLLRRIPHFEQDSVAKALQEKRLYMVDYSALQEVRLAERAPQKEGMFLYAPRALFAVPQCITDVRSGLLPLAIRCGQEDLWPMYTACESHTARAVWHAAKTAVQVADGYTHEAVYHLARTHLVMEAMLCATKRALDVTHPIARLLGCHFEGTAFINKSSVRSLMCDGGLIDRITAPRVDHTRWLAGRSVAATFSFNDSMPDVDAATRGIAHIPMYPYRDDALALWDCLVEWADGYLRAFYKEDADVRADTELQDWSVEISRHGRIDGFGDVQDGDAGIDSISYLVRAVAMVMFTGSVQHAAVNFAQARCMQFTPAMPLCGYRDAPRGAPRDAMVDSLSDDAIMAEMMPDEEQAEKQLCTAQLLGVMRYSRLGHYGRALDFAPEDVGRALTRFEARLAEVQSRVEGRNCEEREAGLPVYDYLAPTNIPQSTNV